MSRHHEIFKNKHFLSQNIILLRTRSISQTIWTGWYCPLKPIIFHHPYNKTDYNRDDLYFLNEHLSFVHQVVPIKVRIYLHAIAFHIVCVRKILSKNVVFFSLKNISHLNALCLFTWYTKFYLLCLLSFIPPLFTSKNMPISLFLCLPVYLASIPLFLWSLVFRF